MEVMETPGTPIWMLVNATTLKPIFGATMGDGPGLFLDTDQGGIGTVPGNGGWVFNYPITFEKWAFPTGIGYSISSPFACVNVSLTSAGYDYGNSSLSAAGYALVFGQ